MIGGQACILYGGAEFSRDIDITIMISPENLDSLEKALYELSAERIFYPSLSEEVLNNGHACHFKCRREDIDEEDREKEADRQYWEPLRKQLEEWRLKKES